MTDSWDPSIPEHKSIAHKLELGNGIPEMRSIKRSREALKTVGFEIEHEEDLAERPDAVPWYYPLEGKISNAQTFWDYLMVWRISWSGKFISHNTIWLLERLGLLPKGTYEVSESLKVAAEALVEGGQKKVRKCHYPGYPHVAELFFFTAVYSHVPCRESKTQELECCIDYILHYILIMIIFDFDFLVE